MKPRLNPLVLALLIAVAGTLPAAAQNSKETLYRTADAAATAGRVEESQKAYCQLAKLDPKFRDAKMLCAIMTEELARENKKNEERFTTGVKEFAQGRFDSAQHQFANIRFGVRLTEAQEYLKVKIPQARATKR